MKLTVDKNGNDATSPDFDPAERRPVGLRLAVRPTTAPGLSRPSFGAGSLLADDGKTAQIPDADAHRPRNGSTTASGRTTSSPPRTQINSDLLAKGSEFASGNLAMNEVHTWFTCCVNPAAPAKPIVGDNFGWAVAPSYNGTTTAKLHADTFSMLKTTKHPDETFAVLSALAASGDLATIYGAMPADPTQQQAVQGLDRQAVPEGASSTGPCRRRCSATRTSPTTRPGSPTTPSRKTAWQAFWNKYRTTPGVDIDAELDTLKTTLQGIFDAAPDKNP